MLVEHHHPRQQKQMYPGISTLQEYIHAYCTILFLLERRFSFKNDNSASFNSPKCNIYVADTELFKYSLK